MALSLSACATDGAALDSEGLIPKALTTCADAPPVPPRPPGVDAQGQPLARSDEAKAGYLAGIYGAYEDCKSTVAAIAQRRKALDAQAGKPDSTSGAGGFHITLNPVKH